MSHNLVRVWNPPYGSIKEVICEKLDERLGNWDHAAVGDVLNACRSVAEEVGARFRCEAWQLVFEFKIIP